MGLFSKKPSITFTPWPEPRDKKKEGVYWRSARELRLLEEVTFAPVIEALAVASGNPQYLMGRVVVVGKEIVVESWGQTVGRIEPRQAAYWRTRIVEGWAFGYFWIKSTNSRGWHIDMIRCEDERFI